MLKIPLEIELFRVMNGAKLVHKSLFFSRESRRRVLMTAADFRIILLHRQTAKKTNRSRSNEYLFLHDPGEILRMRPTACRLWSILYAVKSQPF